MEIEEEMTLYNTKGPSANFDGLKYGLNWQLCKNDIIQHWDTTFATFINYNQFSHRFLRYFLSRESKHFLLKAEIHASSIQKYSRQYYTGCLFYDLRYLMIHISETSILFLAYFSGYFLPCMFLQTNLFLQRWDQSDFLLRWICLKTVILKFG